MVVLGDGLCYTWKIKETRYWNRVGSNGNAAGRFMDWVGFFVI